MTKPEPAEQDFHADTVEQHAQHEAETLIERMFRTGIAYSCNGSPIGCEGERFGGCLYCEQHNIRRKPPCDAAT